MTIKFIQARKVRLASPVGTSDTSFIVTNLKDIYGNTLTMADFGSIGHATIDPGVVDSVESFSFTGITDNGDGTWTLTGITRGLEAKSDYGAGGTARSHNNGAKIIITDTVSFWESFVNKENGGTMIVPLAGPDPVGLQDYATRKWVLENINGGPVSIEALVISGNAGETITDGDSVYLNTSDGEWYKTDADTLATVKKTLKGIAQGAGTNGSAITGGVMLRGVDDAQSGGSLGSLGYISNTAGDIGTTPGTFGKAVGIYLSATELYFDPNWQSGDEVQNNDFTYEADAGSNDSYAITLVPGLGSYRAGLMVHFMANTANTGACTLNINGLGAKSIKKGVTNELATGDILAGQLCTVIYDGVNFQIISKLPTKGPSLQTLTTNSRIGDSTTRFDITNTAGTTYRYTWDSTGTDPGITALTFPVGTVIDLQGQNFNAGNKGLFIVIASGANFFEITNASGVAENDKTIGNGYIVKGGYYIIPEHAESLVVEIGGAGSASPNLAGEGAESGGGAGGYAKKFYNRSAIVTKLGTSTTQFDITNPAGTTFRYTWDGTGTNPGISASTLPIGYSVRIFSKNFTTNNNDTFVITGVGSNYFEVTNASGVVESNKILDIYGILEIVSVPYVVGPKGVPASAGTLTLGGRTVFKAMVALPGSYAPPSGGLASGGDINVSGGPGSYGNYDNSSNDAIVGAGGSNPLGGGACHSYSGSDAPGLDAPGYCGGGGGAVISGTGSADGGDGGDGVIYVTEY